MIEYLKMMIYSFLVFVKLHDGDDFLGDELYHHDAGFVFVVLDLELVVLDY